MVQDHGMGHQTEASACKLCPGGTYGKMGSIETKNGDVSQGCTRCEPGFYSKEIGLVNECKGTCIRGRFATKDLLKHPLPANQSVDEKVIQDLLTISKDLEKACEELCPKGRYGFKEGASEMEQGCSKCSPGRYGSEVGIPNKCKHECPLGRYADPETKEPITMNETCIHYCNPGKFGINTGKSDVDLACQDCKVGRYQDVKGQRICIKCKSYQFAKEEGLTTCQDCPGVKIVGSVHKTCYNHGDCDQTTGTCKCDQTKGWIPGEGQNCEQCDSRDWDVSDATCSKCAEAHSPYQVSGGKIKCLPNCLDGQDRMLRKDKPDDWECPKTWQTTIINILSIVAAVVSFILLFYKAFLFYVYKKSGRLKKEYHNLQGFFLILAFGKKGNHMVGYEENVLGEKKRRRKSRKGSIQRRKSSLVEMPDAIFDRNGSDDNDEDKCSRSSSKRSRSRRKTFDDNYTIDSNGHSSSSNRKKGRKTFSDESTEKKATDTKTTAKTTVRSILKKPSIVFKDYKSESSEDEDSAKISSIVNQTDITTKEETNIVNDDVKISINDSTNKPNNVQDKIKISFAPSVDKKANDDKKRKMQLKIRERQKTNERYEKEKAINAEKEKDAIKRKKKEKAKNEDKQRKKIRIEDLLEKLNMSQYVDNLQDIGCDTLEMLVLASTEDLVNDGKMKKMHAKILIKAARKVLKKYNRNKR